MIKEKLIGSILCSAAFMVRLSFFDSWAYSLEDAAMIAVLCAAIRLERGRQITLSRIRVFLK